MQQQIERGKRLIYSMRQAQSRPFHHYMKVVAALTAIITRFPICG
jgi:hypothetical protein